VLVEDSLFATLDPTTRRTTTADGRVYTMSDTVGFVRHLPHQLVEAFRSTLEEVAGADLVVHVVDGAHPDPEEQVRAVREVLAESAPTGCRAAGGQQDRRGRRDTLLRLKRSGRTRSSCRRTPEWGSTSCGTISATATRR
jgi:GTP-binding protein HflX